MRSDPRWQRRRLLVGVLAAGSLGLLLLGGLAYVVMAAYTPPPSSVFWTPTLDVSKSLLLGVAQTQSLAATNRIEVRSVMLLVQGSTGAVTLTSTPTIPDGLDGQIIILMGMDNTKTVTVQDQGTLANSNLELGATTRVLGQGDTLVLIYHNGGNPRYVPSVATSNWYEVAFTNN